MTITIDTEAVEVFPDTAQTLRLDRAGNLIASASRWSLAAALIPLPYLDMAALAGLQTKLVIDLADLYGQKASKEVVSGAISVLLGTLVPVGAVHATVGATAKLFPGVGTIVGSVSMAAFGAAATYAVGKVFVRHFENGGTMTNLGEAKLQAELRKEFVKATTKD
jgi:uncharacterized protein (DUF697 family)